MQAKDVPEAPIIDALSKAIRPLTHWDGEDPWLNLPAAAPELRAFPQKVLLSKLRSMARRGLISGCGCGCRGDWQIAKDGG